MHLTFDEYLLLIRGAISADQLSRQAHRHLADLCPKCRQEWEVARGAGAYPPGDDFVSVRPVEHADHWPLGEEQAPNTSSESALDVDSGCYEREKAHLAKLRELRRRAREDLARLGALPREQWAARVERATSRYRSRSLAELLVEEAATRVASAPLDAAALASLVPLVLVRHAGADGPAWARQLILQASAWHANGLRVAGDLRGADKVFSRLFQSVREADLEDAGLRAEVLSLDASLRIDRREFSAAELQLEAAAAAYGEAHDDVGLAKTLIKRANLSQALGRPAEMPPVLSRVATLLESTAEGVLLQCTVTAWVNSLCDLGRASEARQVLQSHKGLYAKPPNGHAALVLSGLRARVDLGEGQLDEAREGFVQTRDGLLALGRNYDAAQASLYLADVLLQLGNFTQLHHLTKKLIVVFEAIGVRQETLAALRLMIESVRAQTVTSAMISDLRSLLRDER